MSYHVYLFRKEVRAAESKSTDEGFWEDESNLEPFTPEQKQYIHNRLLRYGFAADGSEAGKYVHKKNPAVDVLLTENGLYFSSGFDDVFETGMIASEFTDTGEFAKYDPQHAQWNDGL